MSDVGIGLDLLGYVAAFLTAVAFVPQAAKTIRSRDTRGISLTMYLLFTTGEAFWLAYGIALISWPIILLNAIVLALALAILASKLQNDVIAKRVLTREINGVIK